MYFVGVAYIRTLCVILCSHDRNSIRLCTLCTLCVMRRSRDWKFDRFDAMLCSRDSLAESILLVVGEGTFEFCILDESMLAEIRVFKNN